MKLIKEILDLKANILLAVMILSVSTSAMASNREEQLSLSPVVGGYTFDSRQHLKTSTVVGLRAGFNFTQHIGIEALVDYVNTSREGNSKDVNMFRYGGEVLYHFFPEKIFVPYIAAGFSGIDFNSLVPKSESHGVFDYGVGAKYFLTDTFALRADIRHLITTANSPRNNLEYTVGAYIPFGGVAKAAKPVENRADTAVTPPVQAVQPAAAPAKSPTGSPSDSPVKASATESVKQAPQPYAAMVKRSCDKPTVLNIHFDFDRAEIKPQYYSELKVDGDFLNEFPNSKGKISGHTDSIGSMDYNIKLSERRAANVKKYLVEKIGVDAARISTQGYGESKPIDSNRTAAGRSKNRRIEAVFECE
jgi:OOP family OmpA-OmpF porin